MNSFHVDNFSLKHTIGSGQFFSYEQENGWYYITTPHRVFKVRQDGKTIYFDNIEEEDVQQFLGLFVPYVTILSHLKKDAVLRRYVQKFHGLRIMRLDPWQCMVFFSLFQCGEYPQNKT